MSALLIVDDDPTIRTMFARALKSLGEVEQAANGADALRMLAVRKYAVVLLDLHMPVVDGFAILHALASKPGLNRDTPIYVVTADMSDQARIRALRRHAVFFLTKPVPIATLVALVDSTLKKSAARAATPRAAGASGRETPTPPGARPTPLPPVGAAPPVRPPAFTPLPPKKGGF